VAVGEDVSLTLRPKVLVRVGPERGQIVCPQLRGGLSGGVQCFHEGEEKRREEKRREETRREEKMKKKRGENEKENETIQMSDDIFYNSDGK
jgi:hypothetical protein